MVSIHKTEGKLQKCGRCENGRNSLRKENPDRQSGWEKKKKQSRKRVPRCLGEWSGKGGKKKKKGGGVTGIRR